MISLRILPVLLALLLVFEARASDRSDRPGELNTAVQQFRAFYLSSKDAFALRDTNEPAPALAEAHAYAQTLNEKGAWPDIDYWSQTRSSWPAAGHLSRMNAMVALAGQADTPAHERALLLAATHRAFAFWIAHDFQCDNWWYNEIGAPKYIGTCALLLGHELKPEELAYSTNLSLGRYPIGRTGQNKVWLAGNAAMRGLLLGDTGQIAAAAAALWSEVRISTEEGIQPDYSFHQHGPQQQFGNYGKAFAAEVARWGAIFHGTSWRLPAEELAAFRQFLLQGQNWVSWRGAMDISACGRQLMPGSPREKTSVIARAMEIVGPIDAAHGAEYRAFAERNHPGARNDLVGNRYFWRSDYLIHRRPDFMATLKLSSSRVIGSEAMNRENLSGYRLGDGALYFYRTGDEYEDIFPIWNWSKLPGVTCAAGSLPVIQRSFVERDFVGGISDGREGLAVLDYVRDDVHAKKAWFFSGDAVVCLGADISGNSATPVETTLNQCLLRGTVRLNSRQTARIGEPGDHPLQDVDSVEHDGMRYVLLDAPHARLETGPVTGHWRAVFDTTATPTEEVTKDRFLLSISHGTNPVEGHYAYVISPVDTQPAVHVLANSGGLQAVRLDGEKVGIVFWRAGSTTLPDGRTLTVSLPCLVLVAGNTVLVADPTQKLASLQLTIGRKTQTVELPAGAHAGSARAVNVGETFPP